MSDSVALADFVAPGGALLLLEALPQRLRGLLLRETGRRGRQADWGLGDEAGTGRGSRLEGGGGQRGQSEVTKQKEE